MGSPIDRIREDRLRALRAIRFAARFEFDIDRGTWDAIQASALDLQWLSAERVKQELEKTMEQVRRPARALSLWRESGALRVLIPALASIDDVTINALDCLAAPIGRHADQRIMARLAELFWGVDGKKAHFAAVQLRFSRHQAMQFGSLAESWFELGSRMQAALTAGPPEPVLARRWLARIGRLNMRPFWRIAAARWAAARQRREAAPTASVVRQAYRISRLVYHDPVEIDNLAIDGDDLLKIPNLTPGPQIRQILERLLDHVLEDPSRNNRAHLIVYARQLYENFPFSG